MRYVFRKKIKRVLASFFDLLGEVLIKPFNHRYKLTQHSIIQNILVVRLDHLGDVLLSSGIPKALKQSHPQAKICFLTSSWGAELLSGNPFIDEVLIYDAPWFAAGRYKKSKNKNSFLGIIKKLKSKNIDIALSLRGDLRENYLCWVIDAKHRVGYGITGGGFFLNHCAQYNDNLHEQSRIRHLLECLGVQNLNIAPKIYISDEEKLDFKKKYPEFQSKIPNVGYLLNAGASSKDWPPDKNKDFIKSFVTYFPQKQLVLVGKKNKASQAPGDHVIDFRDRTTIRELCILISLCESFVGPDSGPTHIASAMGIPSVFLFSGTNDFARWKPLAEKTVVLKHSVPCEPCLSNVCTVKNHPCMSEISVHEVVNALQAAGKL